MHQSRLDALFRQQQLRRPCASLYQAFLVIRCQSETKKLARTTWPETHRPGGLGSSTGCWRDLCFWPLNFLAVINVLCLNGSNIPFNSSNHGYAFRTERLRVIGITPRAWIRMEGSKPLCFCVLQLDNDRRALALRSIVLNVSPFNKIKGQFVIVYLLLRRQVHIFYESTVVHEL